MMVGLDDLIQVWIAKPTTFPMGKTDEIKEKNAGFYIVSKLEPALNVYRDWLGENDPDHTTHITDRALKFLGVSANQARSVS